MTKKNFSKAEAGIAQVAVIIIVLIFIGVAAAVYFMVRSSKEPADTDQSNAESSLVTVAARNTARQNDASSLLAAVSEYRANNNGNLPTDFVEGSLVGPANATPSGVVLEYYPGVVFGSGAQSPQTSTSELRLVTGAACASGGATTAGSSRSFVAQFATEKDDGDGYVSECKGV